MRGRSRAKSVVSTCRTTRTTRIRRRTSWIAMTRIRVARSPPRIATTKFPIPTLIYPPRIATTTNRVAPRRLRRIVTTRIPVAAPRSPLPRMKAMPGLCIARPPRERNCSPLRRMIMAASTTNESPSLWYVNKNV